MPESVVAEVSYLRELGSSAEAAFHRLIAAEEVTDELVGAGDWSRIDLIEQYSDLGLGGTDASVIAATERLGTATMPRSIIGIP